MVLFNYSYAWLDIKGIWFSYFSDSKNRTLLWNYRRNPLWRGLNYYFRIAWVTFWKNQLFNSSTKVLHLKFYSYYFDYRKGLYN
jgi:hypothetical protein